MDPPSSNGVSTVPKYSSTSTTFMNTFLWYFFETLTLSSMLLMVLSIYYWTPFSSGNIQGICVIIVAFAIISPTFIIPKLPTLAAVAIPIVQLNKKYLFIRLLNITVWNYFGYVYPFPAILLCYSLMAGVGLLKLYGDDIEGPYSLQFISLIGADAAGTSLYMFDYEIKHGTGRWVDSLTGWALLGLFAVTMLAYYLPPLVKPEKKKVMMNETEAILTEIAASEKKEKVNVDHVAEAPILGSGTLEQRVIWRQQCSGVGFKCFFGEKKVRVIIYSDISVGFWEQYQSVLTLVCFLFYLFVIKALSAIGRFQT